MDGRELKGRVLEAFEHEGAPRFDQIAPHRCAECDELAKDLRDRDPLDIPLETFGISLLGLAAAVLGVKAILSSSLDIQIDRPTGLRLHRSATHESGQ